MDLEVKTLIVALAALALSGCAGGNFGANDLVLSGVAKSGAREALQRQLDVRNCHRSAHGDPTRLADATEAYQTTIAFIVAGTAKSAQLDDPTRDWTREQAAGPTAQCAATGRKHRYFA